MKHLVITIGCEYGAKGNAIGKKIAQDLGIKFYDRDLVDEIIKEVGIPTDIMDRVEEGGTIAGKGAQGDVRGSFSKYADLTDRAIHVQKQIIRKLAQKEACVIIGRSADYILKNTEGIQLVRAFIYAPNDVRVHNIMESHNLSEKDAKLLLDEKDKRYHKRHLALTGSNRGDRHNRDILINSDFLGIQGTAEYLEDHDSTDCKCNSCTKHTTGFNPVTGRNYPAPADHGAKCNYKYVPCTKYFVKF